MSFSPRPKWVCWLLSSIKWCLQSNWNLELIGPVKQPVYLKLQTEVIEMKLVIPSKAVDCLSHLGNNGGTQLAWQAGEKKTKPTHVENVPKPVAPQDLQAAGACGVPVFLAPRGMLVAFSRAFFEMMTD